MTDLPVEKSKHPAVADPTSWRRWYWLVLGALALEIGLMAYVTRLFA